MYNFLYLPAGVALVARGITRFTLFTFLTMTVLTLTGVLVLRPATPVAAVWVWAIAQLIVFPPMQYFTARLLGSSLMAQIRPGLPALALTIVAVACAFLLPRALGEPDRALLLMLERLAVGGVIYAAGAAVLLRANVLAAMRTIGMRGRPA